MRSNFYLLNLFVAFGLLAFAQGSSADSSAVLADANCGAVNLPSPVIPPITVNPPIGIVNPPITVSPPITVNPPITVSPPITIVEPPCCKVPGPISGPGDLAGEYLYNYGSSSWDVVIGAPEQKGKRVLRTININGDCDVSAHLVDRSGAQNEMVSGGHLRLAWFDDPSELEKCPVSAEIYALIGAGVSYSLSSTSLHVQRQRDGVSLDLNRVQPVNDPGQAEPQ